jgi:hypothetical protein
MNTSSILAWCTLALGLGAWGGTLYLADRIAFESEARTFAATNQEQASQKQMSAIRTRALAEETKDERAELERLLGSDVVALANTIESAGKSAGVAVRISDALPESAGNIMQAVGFVIEAQAGFASLMRVVAVLESLPLPVSIEQLELEHTAGSGGNAGSWRLSARLRILSLGLTNV